MEHNDTDIDPNSPTEHGSYYRFPTQIVPSSAHSPLWSPQRVSASGADARVRRQSRPYWTSDLSGCICNEELKDWLYSLLYRNYGMVRPVLNFVPTFCEIGTIVDRDHYGEAIVQPEFQQTGDGREKVFRLRKKLVVPSWEVASETVYYPITFPNVNYPPMNGIGKTLGGPTYYVPMPELVIYLDGVPQVRGVDYTVNRSTGIVTHSLAGEITATGGFYILMLMPNEIPMSHIGNGVYEIKSGVALSEPPGGF